MKMHGKEYFKVKAAWNLEGLYLNEYCGLWAERSRIRLPAETIFSVLQTAQTSRKPRPVSCSIVTDVLSQE